MGKYKEVLSCWYGTADAIWSYRNFNSMNKLYESSSHIKSQRKSRHKFLPQELLPNDSCWGWGLLVLLRVLHFLSLLPCSGRPHIQGCMRSTNWTWWVEIKNTRLDRHWKRIRPVRDGEGSEWSKLLFKILKGLINNKN